MPLPFREKLTMLMPPSLFYRRRIAEETRSGEPELAVLAKLVPRGGTAIDVGANLGFSPGGCAHVRMYLRTQRDVFRAPPLSP